MLGYAAAYPDPADRVTLARSIGSNPGLNALFGETRSLQTMAGFTEWRVVLALALVGGIWGMFATTRVLRGEEDTGRAEVLLAGPVTRTGAVAATLAGLAAAWLLCTAITVLGLVAGSGRDLGGGPAVLLGLTLTSLAVVMIGVAAVTSQVAGTRRRATGTAAAVLGVSYGIRVARRLLAGPALVAVVDPVGLAGGGPAPHRGRGPAADADVAVRDRADRCRGVAGHPPRHR